MNPVGALHVAVVTPPVDRSGGIGRMVAYELEEAARQHDVVVTVVDSRGRGGALQSLIRLPVVALRLWRLHRTHPIDVAHVNISTSANTIRKLLLAALLSVMKIPVVLHLHGSGYDEFFASLPALVRRLVASRFRAASVVVVLGSVWERFVVIDLEVDPGRVQVIANAVPGPIVVPERSARDTMRVAFLGEYSTRKGAGPMIDGLALLVDAGVDATLEMAGTGDATEYRNRAADRGVSERIRFHGWVGLDEVDRILNEADALCLPSTAENQPLVVLEAMARGCVPVSTGVGAVPEVLADGRSGLLLESTTPDAIASGLARLVDLGDRQRLASSARELWEQRFTVSRHWDLLEGVWSSAAAGARHGGRA